MRFMSWTGRGAVALLLVASCAMLPLSLDWCTSSCEAHPATASKSAPICHHEASGPLRIAGIPAPCGHDHNGPVAAIGVASAARPHAAAPAVTVDLVAVDLAGVRWIDLRSASPPPPSHLPTLTLPLRL
jgi:hypothetical protein